MNRQNDKKKDGKKSSLSSFGGGRSGYDSFGSYMQRKMELQKKQFGLRLPPTIPPSSTLVAEATTTASAAPPQLPAPPSSLSDSSRSSSGLLAIVDRLKRRHNSCNDTTTVSEHNANNNAFISPKEHGNAPSNEQSRKLFLHPLVFHINGLISRKGFDDVSLQRLIQSRGGDVSKYITPSIHFIVAESLSTAKVRIYQRSKRPVPVVYPDWIAECDLRGKRVDWRPFLIEEVRGVRFSGVMEEGCLWKFMNSNSNDGGDEHILKKRYRGGKQDEVKSQNKIMRVGRYSGAKVGSSSKKQDEEVKEKREEKDKGEHDLNPHNSMLDHMDCKSIAEVATVETTKKFNNNIVLSTEKKTESTHQFSSASSHSKHAKRNLQGKNNNITSAANEKSEQKQQHRPEIDAPKKKLNQQFPVMAKTIAKHQISKTHLTEPPSFPSSHRNPYVTQGRNVGNDPNFLKEYFASSRLSFIGRHRERHNMQQYQPQHNFAAAKKSFSSPSHSIKNIVLHVDMDCFFASVILRKYPQHRDQAVAVGHCDRPTPLSCLPRGSTGELSTCNYLARRQYGIRKGMWISSARVACPSLVMLPYDQEGYAEVSHTVVNIYSCCLVT